MLLSLPSPARLLLAFSCLLSLTTISQAAENNDSPISNSRDPKHAVAQIDVHDPALELTLFASEPLISNPSSIDVDAEGRVWVCEIVNYRHFRNTEFPPREAGDRILVLEDTDHDGKADKSTVFYQGKDIDSPHGVLVLGNRVIVSANSHVWNLYDDDGDLKADRKEVMFSGLGNPQHDHSIHGFVFGPDGKLYFNFGNECKEIRNKDGNPITDLSGRVVKVGNGPYQQGMVFRCDLDGSNFETLAWNFRNPWELCVDPYGNIWQSDNDDDGNKATRINFVMEFGNYGFNDEMTKEAWRADRTNLEKEIPDRHWHQNDPGVVPNMLITGAGSPCGILYYQGDLLGEKYKGQLIHCDAGPNMVRVYYPKPDGAGYTATQEVLVEGKRDQWFRPTDVCTAPDGSLFISDWYDGGVGGHRMVDIDKGRIFRLAPRGQKYEPKAVDVSTAEGAVKAAISPNMATRYLGWDKLMQVGEKAQPSLKAAAKKAGQTHQKAALMWVIGLLADHGTDDEIDLWKREFIKQLAQHATPDLVITNLRLARRLMLAGRSESQALIASYDDAFRKSPPVVREQLISMRQLNQAGVVDAEELGSVVLSLAEAYQSGDRWMLEALGIALNGHWDAVLEAIAAHWDLKPITPAMRELIWRSRGGKTPKLLAKLIRDSTTPTDDLPRYFRSMDFVDLSNVQNDLKQLAFETSTGDSQRDTIILMEAAKRLKDVRGGDRQIQARIVDKLNALTDDATRLSLVRTLKLKDQSPLVWEIATRHFDQQLGIDAATYLVETRSPEAIATDFKGLSDEAARNALTALEKIRSPKLIGFAKSLVSSDDVNTNLKRGAIRTIGSFDPGRKQLIVWVQEGTLDDSYAQTIAPLLHASSDGAIKSFANKQYPLPPSKNAQPLPPVSELAKLRGDVAAGKLLYHTTGTCGKCHIAQNVGIEVGPNLSEIGSKLSRESMFESILYPSAGISHGFESYNIITTEGIQEVGLLVSESADEVKLKNAEGLLRTIPTSQIELKEKQDISLMPADLQKLLTEKELVDIVEFLMTLKRQ